MAAEHPEAARARLRWAVNIGAWQPCGGAEGPEWRFLASLLPTVRSHVRRVRHQDKRDTRRLPQDAATKVNKFVHFDDRKRALCR